jgi:hypothetical protein
MPVQTSSQETKEQVAIESRRTRTVDVRCTKNSRVTNGYLADAYKMDTSLEVTSAM